MDHSPQQSFGSVSSLFSDVGAGSGRRSSFLQSVVRQTEEAVAGLSFAATPRMRDRGSQDEFKDLRRESDDTVRITHLEEQLGHYQAALQKLQEVIIMAAQQAQTAIEKNEDLTLKLETKTAESEHLQHLLDHSKHIYEAEKLLHDEMKTKMLELEEQVVHLQDSKKELQTHLRESEMEVAAQRRDSFVLKGDLDNVTLQLNRDLSKKRSEIQSLEDKLRRAERRASELDVENERLKHVADAAKKKNTSLNAEIDELVTELKALKTHASLPPDLMTAHADESRRTPVMRAARHSPLVGPALGDLEQYQVSDDEEKVPSVLDGHHAALGKEEEEEDQAMNTALDVPESVRARQFVLESLEKVEAALSAADAVDPALVSETLQQVRRDLGLADEDADLLDLAQELGDGAFYVDVEEQRVFFHARPTVDLSKKKEQVFRFFERCAIPQNWGTTYGTPETFKFHFIPEQDDVEAPACFVLPLTMLLAQVIGADKSCEEFDEFFTLEFDDQAEWLADVYHLMKGALSAKSSNDDLYSFLFHFLAFVVCQFPQIEASLGNVCGAAPRPRGALGTSSRPQTAPKQGFWSSLCACFKSSSSSSVQQSTVSQPFVPQEERAETKSEPAKSASGGLPKIRSSGSVKKRSKSKRKTPGKGSSEYLYSAPGGSTHAISYGADVGSDSEVESEDEQEKRDLAPELGFAKSPDVGDEIFSDDSDASDGGEAGVVVYDEPSVSVADGDGDIERIGLVSRT